MKWVLAVFLAIMMFGCGESAIDKSGVGTFKDPRDGQAYKTVKIGNQVWMAQNLNYGKPLESKKDLSLGEKWCYDDSLVNCEKYGGLYTWEVALKSCPEGWHLPTLDEWDELIKFVQRPAQSQDCEEKYLDGSCKARKKNYSVEAEVLASKEGWEDFSGENAFEFNALPSGVAYGNGEFSFLGWGARWWSAIEWELPPDKQFSPFGGNRMAYSRYMIRAIIVDVSPIQHGASIRCLRDSAERVR